MRTFLVALIFANSFLDRLRALILQLLSFSNWWLLNKNSSLDHFWILRFNDELAFWLWLFFWRKHRIKVIIRHCRHVSYQVFDSRKFLFFFVQRGNFERAGFEQLLNSILVMDWFLLFVFGRKHLSGNPLSKMTLWQRVNTKLKKLLNIF